MGRQSWVLHVLRLLIDWVRYRINRFAATISDRKTKPASTPPPRQTTDAVASSSVDAVDRTAITTVIDRVPMDLRQEVPAPGAPDFPAEFPGAERFAEPVVSEPHLDTTEPDYLVTTPAEMDMDTGNAGGGSWSADDTLTFTPDAALDYVDEIEFSFEPEPQLGNGSQGPEGVEGWVRGDGTRVCPDEFPIKGNGNSHIYHLPGQPSYAATIPELCFATENAAAAEGYRPTKKSRSAE